MEFSKVIFDKSVDTDIARVNRKTRVLYINPDIWNRLTLNEREFVLLHEKGHMELQTASEYAANNYAINKFIPVQTLTNAELGKRIQVVTEITDPEKYMSGNFFEGIGNAIGTIGTVSNQTFEIFGIGRKAKAKAAAAAAENALTLENTKAANTKMALILAGVFAVVIIVVYFTFKK